MTYFISAALCICCMILLGFADDVLNLKWKYKLVFPCIATLPILMVYKASGGISFVVIPKWLFNSYFGSFLLFLFPKHPGCIVDIGLFYYIFKILVTIFCTNSINILAGVNGLEVGQSLIIGLSLVLNDLVQVLYYDKSVFDSNHIISVLILVPFLFVTLPLYLWNKYPAKVFVGDTFCYFAGMTFAVAGILGHYSKTLCLFFLPQILNFLYSFPQLFHFFPCPRHRLPRRNPNDDNLNMSLFVVQVPKRPGWRYKIGYYIAKTLSHCGLLFIESDVTKIHVHQVPEFVTGLEHIFIDKNIDSGSFYLINNMTLLNLFLFKFGSCSESTLTRRLLIFQLLCSILAFIIRYHISELVYQ